MNSEQLKDGSWVSRGLDVTTNYGVQFDPFDKQHIYMDNTDMGLFQSTDGGRSWIGSSEGIPENWRNTTYWLAFDPAQRGLIWGAFSGTHDLPRPKMWRGPQRPALQRRSRRLNRWRPALDAEQRRPSGGLHHSYSSRSGEPGRQPYSVCNRAFGRGVYKSTDNGKSWTQKNNGIAGDEPFAWRITPSQDGSLYLVVARRSEMQDLTPALAGALYRSTDKAEHWQRMDMPAGVNGPTGLEVDPRDAQRLYLTAWGTGRRKCR